MTQLQKEIVQHLFNGGNIASYPSGVFRLRDKDHRPIIKIYSSTFNRIRQFMRKEKGLYIISRNYVRCSHGNNWIKKYYKNLQNN